MTQLYLRNLTSDDAPTAGTKSAVLPAGTDRSLTTNDSLVLSVEQGSSGDTQYTITTAAQTALQSGRFGRYTSEPLAAQTVSANTWTLYLGSYENNNSTNAYTAVSMYIWRPSTNAVVGYIYDSASAIGSEWTTNTNPVTVTFSGSAVTIQNGDVLVIEVWYRALQAKSTAYSVSVYIGQTTYISTPQTLSFYVAEPDRVYCWILD